MPSGRRARWGSRVKVIILVLSCAEPPYDALYRAQQETWNSVVVEGVATTFYFCDAVPGMIAHLKAELAALVTEWDFVFRTNSSSYVDKAALRCHAGSLPQERVYQGVDGGGFASGSGFFVSGDVAKLLARELPDEPQEEIEDVAVGRVLARAGIGVLPGARRCDYWHEQFLARFYNREVDLVALRDAYHVRCKCEGDRAKDVEAMRAVHEIKAPDRRENTMAKHRGCCFREIVYLQDDASVEGLEILKRDGRQSAVDYLLQFDKGDGKVRKRLMVPGHQLRVDKYILYYDPFASHIGLMEVVDDVT